jgi:hypothetical protein
MQSLVHVVNTFYVGDGWKAAGNQALTGQLASGDGAALETFRKQETARPGCPMEAG